MKVAAVAVVAVVVVAAGAGVVEMVAAMAAVDHAPFGFGSILQRLQWIALNIN